LEISYDKKYNIAYIKIQEKTSKVETITLSDEVNIDISPDGKIYGIELLNEIRGLVLENLNLFREKWNEYFKY